MSLKPLKLLVMALSLVMFLPHLSVQAEQPVMLIGQAEGNFLHRVAVPVLREAYQRLGIRTEFEAMPARRTITIADSGVLDGVLMRTKKILESHPNLRVVDVPILTNGANAITVRDNIDIQKWADLAPYKIATINGLMAIESQVGKYNPQRVNSYEQAFTLLVRGRVDVIVVPLFNAAGEIKRFNKIRPLYIHRPPLHAKAMHHFVHKKHEAFIPKLEAVLQQMTDEGVLALALANAIVEMDLPVPNKP